MMGVERKKTSISKFVLHPSANTSELDSARRKRKRGERMLNRCRWRTVSLVSRLVKRKDCAAL